MRCLFFLGSCGCISSLNFIFPGGYFLGRGSIIQRKGRRVKHPNLLKLLNDKKNLRVEIMSHTDSRGNDAYNKSLSQQRAQSVVNHLVSKGISRNRLEAKGYGETRLKNNCSNGVECSDAQHQANRRTEFRILQ